MSLTIETGAIVVGADSYANVADLRAYAVKRGATVPSDDPACEVLLTKACDYLQAQEARFKGERVSQTQALAWPRVGVIANGFDIPSNTIPADIKNAQMALAIEAQSVELLPTIDVAAQQGPVTEETIDVITTKYATPSGNRSVSSFARADGLLSKFYSVGLNQVRMVRS